MWILKFCVTFLTSSRESNGQDYIISSNYMPFGTIGWAKEDDDKSIMSPTKCPLKSLKSPLSVQVDAVGLCLSFFFISPKQHHWLRPFRAIIVCQLAV
ncbi:unnamed protein product [Arabidopsis halleri]